MKVDFKGMSSIPSGLSPKAETHLLHFRTNCSLPKTIHTLNIENLFGCKKNRAEKSALK